VRTALPFDPTVRTILLALNELASPAALGDKIADNDTLPLKPKLFSVSVLVVEPPATKLGGDGAPAIILKSDLTVRVTVTEWTRVPLAPVTVNTYTPAGVEAVVEIVRVELPLMPGVNPTNRGFSEPTSPLGLAATVTFNVTLVVSPRLRTVTRAEVELPATMLEGERLPAVIVKSAVTVSV
jgi:hypothetical protein